MTNMDAYYASIELGASVVLKQPSCPYSSVYPISRKLPRLLSNLRLLSANMGSSSSKFTPEVDMVDLHGKVALVTGGNRGIGYFTVLHLRRAGAKVYLGARSETQAQHAIASMDADLGQRGEGSLDTFGQAVFLELHLDDVKGVQQAAKRVLQTESRLDIIVTNAAVVHECLGINQEGVGKSMAVNHLAHFTLVETLLPLLEKTSALEDSDVRVVIVSSDAHKFPWQISFKTTEGFNYQHPSLFRGIQIFRVYGQSKAANILYAGELQRRLVKKGSRILSISLHPGVVGTGSFVDTISLILPALIAEVLRKYLTTTPEEGSYTTLFAAASQEVRDNKEIYRGAYLLPVGRVAQPKWFAVDQKNAEDLWRTSEDILKEKYAIEL